MAGNPYAAPPPNPGQAPHPAHGVWGGPGRYAVPGIDTTTDPDYTTGYSPVLKTGGSPDGSALPDDIRTGHREPPVGENYNDPSWQAHQNSEFLKRHSVEVPQGMWKVKQETVPAPRVPEWTQDRLPVRPTANNSPLGYTFQRPWHIPRNAAEAIGPNATLHFSMADHRRDYEIMAMKPQGRVGSNTYRASPQPWDSQLFTPPAAANVGTPISGGGGPRSYRLG